MSQPAHVRNDAQIDDYLGGLLNNRLIERLEHWAKKYFVIARGFMTPPDLASKLPTIPPEKFASSAALPGRDLRERQRLVPGLGHQRRG
jgi:hypothetical protein